jgi:hypothetical protein
LRSELNGTWMTGVFIQHVLVMLVVWS